MKRRLFSILLITVMILNLTACNKTKPAGEVVDEFYGVGESIEPTISNKYKDMVPVTLEADEYDTCFSVVTEEGTKLLTDILYAEEVVIPETVEIDNTEYVITGINFSNEYNVIPDINSCGVQKITLPGTIAVIEEFSFRSVKVPEIVLSEGCKYIGDGAFFCAGITTVHIPESVTYLGESCFYSCKSLSTIIGCEGITYVGYSAFEDTPFYTDKCAGDELVMLGSILISGQNIEGKIDIPKSTKAICYSAFSGNTSITEVNFSDNVKTIGGRAFAGCTNLEKVTLNKGLVCIEGSAFSGAKSLTEIIIPESVEFIDGYAFYECFSLENVVIPSDLQEIGKDAFSQTAYSRRLKDELLEKGESPLLTVNGVLLDMSEHTNEELRIPDNVEYIADGVGGSFRTAYTVTIPGHVKFKGSWNSWDGNIRGVIFEEGRLSIDSGLFIYNEDLKRVVLPEGLEVIEAEAFRECESLEEINFPSTLKVIEDYALYATELSSIELNEGLEEIGNYALAFAGSPSVKELHLPSTVKHIGEESLTSICDVIYVNEGVESIYENSFSFAPAWSYGDAEVVVYKGVKYTVDTKDAFFEALRADGCEVKESEMWK